jgi:phage FluMu protein Com
MGEQIVRVAAEWQPGLTCFCPSCKLHINILRVPVQAGTVKDVGLTVGLAFDGDLLELKCPNCGVLLAVTGVKAGRSVGLSQLVGEGGVETQQ